MNSFSKITEILSENSDKTPNVKDQTKNPKNKVFKMLKTMDDIMGELQKMVNDIKRTQTKLHNEAQNHIIEPEEFKKYMQYVNAVEREFGSYSSIKKIK